MITKIKEKYEIILGFVTLVVSLSAFKDELAKVILDLGYAEISLANYFLYIVYGFCVCLYFYILEKLAQDTLIGGWKIFDYIIQFAFFLFVLILITPIIILLNLAIFKLYSLIVITPTMKGGLEQFFSLLISILSLIISTIASNMLYKEQEKRKQEEIEIQEIKELDNANKLYADGYFSHSILESFKVLETHLYKLLLHKSVRVQRHQMNEIIKLALKYEIIGQDDLPVINDIRVMRNSAAHSDTQYNKEQAETALNYVKKLLKKN